MSNGNRLAPPSRLPRKMYLFSKRNMHASTMLFIEAFRASASMSLMRIRRSPSEQGSQSSDLTLAIALSIVHSRLCAFIVRTLCHQQNADPKSISARDRRILFALFLKIAAFVVRSQLIMTVLYDVSSLSRVRGRLF